MQKSMQWIVGGIAGSAVGLMLTNGKVVEGRQDPAPPPRAISFADGDPFKPSDPGFAALRKAVSIDFSDVPLRQAIEEVRRQLGANLVVDSQGLENAMVDLDRQKISLRLVGVRASTVLRLMLTPHGLACAPENGVLIVADRESTTRKNISRFYPVADLAIRPLAGDVESTGEKLAAFIPNLVDYDVWAVHGGDCTVEYYAPTPALFINCPAETHEKLEGAFEALKTLKGRLPALLREAGLPDLQTFYTRRRVVLSPTGDVQSEEAAQAVGADKSTADLAKEAKSLADTALLLALRLEAASGQKPGAPAAGRKE